MIKNNKFVTEPINFRRKIVEFSPDAKKRLKVIWRGMRKYMDGFPDHIYHALNTFLIVSS